LRNQARRRRFGRGLGESVFERRSRIFLFDFRFLFHFGFAAETRRLQLFQCVHGAIEGSLNGSLIAEELAEVFREGPTPGTP
jgi:hypothetical protein